MVLLAQGVRLVLQIATVMLLARFLTAADFGLQSMVAAFIGFIATFSEGGLATASIQRADVTHAQISTLFWINVAIGATLWALSILLAPAVVAFYGDPRLYWITVVSGSGFVLGGCTAQHQALMIRTMRFGTLAKIELISLIISSVLGILMAALGAHYWAIVCMGLASSVAKTAGVWLAVAWLPGLPRLNCGVRSMIRFGWMTTLTGLIVYFAWNTDNILIGRVWGADALGLYGRAFQLATLPIHLLNEAVTWVAFSALSRLQNDPDRLARSFLRGYFLLLSLTMPIVVTCALFSTEIVRVLLGANWLEVAPIFRLLTPAALVFALANPLSLLVTSTGHIGRSLAMAAATTPPVIAGIALGLINGPKGVALGYSISMALVIIPIIGWSKQGTKISWRDFWETCKKPLLSAFLAGVAGVAVKIALGGVLPPILLLIIGVGVVFVLYAFVLLIVMGTKGVYIQLLRELLSKRTPIQSASTGAVS